MSDERYKVRTRTTYGGSFNLLVCTECGVYVENEAVHDNFHDWLLAISAAAGRGDQAYWYNQPIG